MIRLSGYRVGHDVEIRTVGARAGENIGEAIVGPAEEVRRLDGPLVAIVPVHLSLAAVQATVEQLAARAAARDDEGARRVLLEVAAHQALARPA
jgi:FlaA1/EpsC-like NDP-sugar epimerase